MGAGAGARDVSGVDARGRARGAAGSAQRIAVVDLDIHHGSDAEEIVRAVRPAASPARAAAAVVGADGHHTYKPWLSESDAEHVFFGSVHLSTASTSIRARVRKAATTTLLPRCVRRRRRRRARADDRQRRAHPVSLRPATRARARLGPQARRALRARRVSSAGDRVQAAARARRFEPDLLLVSAGFDGMVDDFYHFLRADDYAWVAAELAARVLPPRRPLVSVLGGLPPHAAGRCAAAAEAPPRATRPRPAPARRRRRRGRRRASPTRTPAGALPGDGGLAKGVLAHVGALAAAAAAHP